MFLLTVFLFLLSVGFFMGIGWQFLLTVEIQFSLMMEIGSFFLLTVPSRPEIEFGVLDLRFRNGK